MDKGERLDGHDDPGNKIKDSTTQDLCPVCIGKMSFIMIGPCDHYMCHKCGIKLRALYENTECPFCKVCF